MTDQIVLYEARYPAAIITLNNPAHRNALGSAMIDGLMAAIQRAEADSRVRALIFTGVEPAFSAGMDLGELRGMLDGLRVDNDGTVWEGALRGTGPLDHQAGLKTTSPVTGKF